MFNFMKKEEPKKMSNVLIYTEQTPNPDTLKFVTSKILYDGIADFSNRTFAEEWVQWQMRCISYLIFRAWYLIKTLFPLINKWTSAGEILCMK